MINYITKLLQENTQLQMPLQKEKDTEDLNIHEILADAKTKPDKNIASDCSG